MFKIKFTVLTISMCFMSTLLAQTVENEAESKDCTDKILACGTGLAGAGVAGIASFNECKPVRKCKKEVREEKRDCTREAREVKKEAKEAARGEKNSCKDACEEQFGNGKDYRNCAKSCRADKRDAKDEARDDKREAKSDCKETKEVKIDVCRHDFTTPACKTASTLAKGSAAGSIPTCSLAAICIKANSSK